MSPAAELRLVGIRTQGDYIVESLRGYRGSTPATWNDETSGRRGKGVLMSKKKKRGLDVTHMRGQPQLSCAS